MKIIFKFVLVCLFGITTSLLANAGNNSSGGGGAFLCRDKAGAVLKSLLIDLWEAEYTPFDWGNGKKSIKVNYSNNSVDQQLQEALIRLQRIDSGLSREIAKVLAEVRSSIFDLPSGTTISLPDDLKVRYSPAYCDPVGMMYYDGPSQTLVVDRQIFDILATKTDVAAAYLHEAIYKLFREGRPRVTESTLIRRLVACSFSDDCMSIALYSRPTDRNIFSCTSGSLNALIYSVEPWRYKFHGDTPTGWTAVITNAGSSSFGIPIFDFQRGGSGDGIGSYQSWHSWLQRFGYKALSGWINFKFDSQIGQMVDVVAHEIQNNIPLESVANNQKMTCSKIQ